MHSHNGPVAMSMPEAATAASDFDALFTHFYGRLARLLYRITGDTGRAEEIASEAFWRLHRKRPATNVNVEGWLYRTGTRLALDELKKQQRRSRYEALASLFGIAPNPHQLLEQSEDAGRVRRAVRVDFASLPEEARSLHPTLLHEPTQPQPVTDAGHAAKMAGFVPRLPPAGTLSGAPRLSVMGPMSFGMTVNTSDLELALRSARVVDQRVPREWDGAKLVMQFGPTIVAEWPDISLMQTQPPALSAPSFFDLGEFTVALLRAAGMPRDQAERFGRRMNTAPVLLCGISEDEHVAISDVPLRNGTNGTLIENYGDDGKLERVELLWSGGDRVFVFSGATSVEVAKAVANWTD